jgi:hypothetical protein
MSKKSKIIDGYLRVELRNPGDFGMVVMSGEYRTADQIKSHLQHIKDCITKHVGKYDDERGDIYTIYEYDHICEHCGQEWTEDDPEYNGGCCGRDQLQWENSNAKDNS